MSLEKNRISPKLLITICVFFLLGGLIWKAAEIAYANITLKVEISPVEYTYSFARHDRAKQEQNDPNAFMVRFRVSNPSSTPCTIGIWTCSYFESWGTDNTNVFVQDWGCDRNIPGGMPLGSTNVYSGELPIVVRTNTKPGQLSFRMCFIPVKQELCDDNWSRSQTNWAEGKYWSNEITITVAP